MDLSGREGCPASGVRAPARPRTAPRAGRRIRRAHVFDEQCEEFALAPAARGAGPMRVAGAQEPPWDTPPFRDSARHGEVDWWSFRASLGPFSILVGVELGALPKGIGAGPKARPAWKRRSIGVGYFFFFLGFWSRDHGERGSTGRDPELLADLVLDLVGDVGVVAQERLRVLAPLADALVAVGEPGAALLDDLVLDPEVDQLARLARCPRRSRMSNSASLNGGATLFLTTLTLVRLPMTSVAVLDGLIRRMSRRTEE